MSQKKPVNLSDVLVLANLAYRLEPVKAELYQQGGAEMQDLLNAFSDFQVEAKKAIDNDLKRRGMTESDLNDNDVWIEKDKT